MSAVEPSKTGTATAVFFLTTTMSGAIGAWAGGVAADAFGYDVVAAGGAVLALIGVATAAQFLPDLGSDTSRSGSGSHASGGMDYLTVFRQPGMWTIVLLRFWPTVAWGIATLVIPLYLYRIAGNATVPGTYALVSLVIASGGQLVTGRLIDRGARMSVGSVAGVPVALRRLTAVVSVGLLIAGAAAIFATDNVYVLGAGRYGVDSDGVGSLNDDAGPHARCGFIGVVRSGRWPDTSGVEWCNAHRDDCGRLAGGSQPRCPSDSGHRMPRDQCRRGGTVRDRC